VAERQLRADARRNRERVMAAARDAFAANGEKATLDDIARRAGVGPGTLYRHFPDRESLLAAVYRDEIDALCAKATSLAATYPPREALAVWLRLQFDYIKTKRGLGTAVKQILGTESDTLQICKDAMRAAVSELLVRAQDSGDVRKEVEPGDVLRLGHAVAMATETDPGSADRLLGYVLDGLRPPAA
jgi:AcrR family transcriptional regulator